MLKRLIVKLLVGFQLNSVVFSSLLHANFFETYARVDHDVPYIPYYFSVTRPSGGGLHLAIASPLKNVRSVDEEDCEVSIIDTLEVPSFSSLNSKTTSPNESDDEHDSQTADYLDAADDFDNELVFSAEGVDVESSGSSFSICGLRVFVNNSGEMLITGTQEEDSRPVFLNNMGKVIFQNVKASNLQVMASSFACVGAMHADYLSLIGIENEYENSSFVNSGNITAKQLFLKNLHSTNTGSIDVSVLDVEGDFDNLRDVKAKEVKLLNGNFKNQGNLKSDSIAGSDTFETFENTESGIVDIKDDGWVSFKGSAKVTNAGIMRGGNYYFKGSYFTQSGTLEGISLTFGKNTKVTTSDRQSISLQGALFSESTDDWDLRGAVKTPEFTHDGALKLHGALEAGIFKGFGTIESSGSLNARDVIFTKDTVNEGSVSAETLEAKESLQIRGTAKVANAANIKGQLRIALGGKLEGVADSELSLTLGEDAIVEGSVDVDHLNAKEVEVKKSAQLLVRKTSRLDSVQIAEEAEARLNNLYLNGLLIRNNGTLIIAGFKGNGALKLDNDGKGNATLRGTRKSSNTLRLSESEGLNLGLRNTNFATICLQNCVFSLHGLDGFQGFTNQGTLVQEDAEVRVKESTPNFNAGTWKVTGDLALPEYKCEDIGKFEVGGNLAVTTELDALKALEGVKAVKAAKVKVSAPTFVVENSHLYSWPVALDVSGDTTLKGKFEAPTIDLRTKRFLAVGGNPLGRIFARNEDLSITTEYFDNSHGQLYGKTGVSINGFSYFKNGDRLPKPGAANGELKYDRNKAGIFSKDGPIVISTPQPIDILNYYGIISSKEGSVAIDTLGDFRSVTGFVFAKNRGLISAKQIQLTRDEQCGYQYYKGENKGKNGKGKCAACGQSAANAACTNGGWGGYCWHLTLKNGLAESSDQSILWCEGGAWDPKLSPADAGYVAPQNRRGWELNYQNLHTLASQVWSGGHIYLNHRPLGAAASSVVVTKETEDPKASGTKVEPRNTHKSLFKAACDIRGELGKAKVDALFNAEENIALSALSLTLENLGLRGKAAKGMVLRLMRGMREEAQSARMLEMRNDAVVDSCIPYGDTYTSIGVVSSVGQNHFTNHMAVTCSAVKQQLAFVLPSLSRFCKAAGFTVDQLILNGYRNMAAQSGALSRSVMLNYGRIGRISSCKKF